jgi:ketosteroid isomerase-like protein
MTDITTLVQDYLGAWNETDGDARLQAIEQLWTEDGTYVDPVADIGGRTQISNLIGAVQQQLPGLVFRLRDGVDAHHNVARFGWELVPPDGGDSIVEGFDVAVIDDGRISSVVAFLDKAPAA